MLFRSKVEWAKNVRAGYLDQHAVLEKGMTIQEVLKSAFDPLLQKEQRMNEICDLLGSADEEEMNVLMEELGTIQDELTLHDFYVIDSKVEEVARALGLLPLVLPTQKSAVLLLAYMLQTKQPHQRFHYLRFSLKFRCLLFQRLRFRFLKSRHLELHFL